MSSMVEATGAVLFLYRPLAWCFLRGMKYLSILIVGVALLVGGCSYSPTKGLDLFVVPLVDGKQHGTEIRYYEDGSKKLETPSVNGKKHDTEIEYQEYGWKVSETIWKNGEEVSRKYY